MIAAWQVIACRLAQERAEIEARLTWQIGKDDVIPFNYRWEHVQAVVGLALHLADALHADREIVEASAWLHDICKMLPKHGSAGATEAIQVLKESDFPQVKIPAVAYAILHHVGLFRPEGEPSLTPVETAILWDADKLSKLGVQSIIYSVSAPYHLGKSVTERRADFKQFAQKTLTRTVASMNTIPAQRIATRRYEEMMQAMESWASEEAEQLVSKQ
jgi:uncharacterized protein